MKNRAAFTLIEVLLASALLIAAAYVTAHVQMRAMWRVMSDRENVRTISLLKRAMYDVLLDPFVAQKKVDTHTENPEFDMQVKMVEIDKKSSLAPLARRLKLLRVQARWKILGMEHVAHMISIIPRDLEQEKNEKASG